MVTHMSDLGVTMVPRKTRMDEVTTKTHDRDETSPATDLNDRISDKQADIDMYIGRQQVIVLRGIFLVAVAIAVYNKEVLQTLSNEIYAYLLSTYIFNSVYFETYWATICYCIMIPVYPWFISKLPRLDKYKIHPSVQYVHTTAANMLIGPIIYMAPLMLLDTFLVKKYCGVDPQIWEDKRKSFIQVTRALPSDPPTLFQIVYQLIASLIVYDIIFFVIHFTLHKNYFLYNYIHKHHHDHGTVHPHVTNQLTIPERIALILSANFALKVFNSHPFTRTIFVPIFLFIIIDNHTGYDMPFGLHRLVPFGAVGGAVKHYHHHMHGTRHYQPIMTYLDQLVELYASRKKKDA